MAVNCAGLKYTLEVTGTESSGKALLPRLFSSCVKIPFEFLHDLIEEPKSRLLSVLLIYQLYRNRFTGHIIARQIIRLLGLPFPLLSSSISFSPPPPLSYYFFSSILSSFLRSRMLSFSLTDFICTLIIFFWRLLYSKRHFLVRFFFSLEILRPKLQSFRLKILLC